MQREISDRLMSLDGKADAGNPWLIDGDLDLQILEHRGTTATLRVGAAWEQMPGDAVILGYFAGAYLRTTDLEGDFSGTRTGYGFDAGAYAVGELADNVHAGGFAAVSFGRNDMDTGNGPVTLAGLYDTYSFLAGGSISGAYDIHGDFVFLPELALRHGQTAIGSIGFAGETNGTPHDGLHLDAATVHTTRLTLRPELRHAPGNGAGHASFAPRLVCEHTSRGGHCGGGAEIGYTFRSQDGGTMGDAQFVVDEIAGALRSRLTLKLKRGF